VVNGFLQSSFSGMGQDAGMKSPFEPALKRV
jgi:hypothetical protein